MKIFNKKSLAAHYGISVYLLEQQIEEIKTEIKWKRGKQIFTPKQVARIMEHLGKPS